MRVVTAICKICCKWQFDQELDKNGNAAHNFVTCNKCKNLNFVDLMVNKLSIKLFIYKYGSDHEGMGDVL
ncbi:MAG: hypothetical protein WBQ25_16215 [Nitrososphaeraceae archaeon]